MITIHELLSPARRKFGQTVSLILQTFEGVKCVMSYIAKHPAKLCVPTPMPYIDRECQDQDQGLLLWVMVYFRVTIASHFMFSVSVSFELIHLTIGACRLSTRCYFAPRMNCRVRFWRNYYDYNCGSCLRLLFAVVNH